VGAVLGIEYDQLRLVRRYLQQRDPEVSDILAVNQIMFHKYIPGRPALFELYSKPLKLRKCGLKYVKKAQNILQ
jgi:hypothetical protein